MMECNKKKKREANFIGPSSFRLPYSNSVKLVLAASQEYFNSASDASDPGMSLAKACLNLIEDVPSSIEEERDLISSISLLQELGVDMLPLQVRICENRMSIIQEALQKKRKNYKKSSKIMKLSFILRAGSLHNQEREGKVLILLGEHAFQAKDYKECYASCKKIIEGGHKEGWSICHALGECHEFDNIPARYSLMSFALAYSSEDLIETILKSKAELELQVLQERVKFLVGDLPVNFPSGDSEENGNTELEDEGNVQNILWQGSEKTRQVFHSTSQTAKVVLTSVKRAQFWKDAVNWIQPPSLLWNSSSSEVNENQNTNLAKQGICAFYDGLIENSHLSAFETNYERYARPDLPQQLEISSSVLQASLIQDSLRNESLASSLEISVLLDVAKAYIPEDLVYSLSVLLSLKQAEKAEVLLASLPSSPVVLQLIALYYATLIYIILGKCPFAEGVELDPHAFIKKVLSLERSGDSLAETECFKCYWGLLQKYNKMLYDFIQAEILHSIGGGVDAIRFANDDEYKKDTILGISMTLDDSVFHTAMSLANHYHVPLWDLYMTHLEYLFSDSNISAAVISERTEKFKLSEKLLEQKKLFELRLRNNVYPGIDGKDHEKLLICLSLLEDCGDNEDSFKIKPSTHKSLLKKFKAALSNIDYKRIMSPELSRKYLATILNESSVHVFAKAAENIPKQESVFYEPSNIYCIWIQKEFYEGNSMSSKVPSTKSEWIHRFKCCSDMLQRLSSADVILFVENVIFSEKALEKMNIDCRSEIIKQVVKFCRVKSSKNKSNIVLSNEWNEAAKTLNSYFTHLERLEDETLVQLRDCFAPDIRSYCKEFDLSRSDIHKLQLLLTKIVMDGPDLELLKTFISCCPANINWEPADAYIEAINTILEKLKRSQNKTSSTASLISRLESILMDISKEKDELMIEDIASRMLNEFCQNSEVSVSVRLKILQLLEKTDCLPPESGNLLLLYRTQAVVSSMFPDIKVSEEELNEEFQRRLLFDNLLSLCKTVDHYISLSKLLSRWPPFQPIKTRTLADEEWSKLLCNLISLATTESLFAAINILGKALKCPLFDEECFKMIFKKIKDRGKILFTLKCALKANYSDVHKEALDILRSKSSIKEEDYDNELLDLVLKHGLTAQIVSTGLHRPVIQFLLEYQDDRIQNSYKSIDSVVKELYEAGYEAEAGSLLLIHKSVHTGLSTYSSAIYFLHKWLSVNKS